MYVQADQCLRFGSLTAQRAPFESSDRVDANAGLSLRRAHLHFCSNAASQVFYC